MNTYSQTLPSLFRPAACYRLQLLLVHFEPERLPHEVGSPQVRRSRLLHRISSGVDGGVEVSVHDLHAFIAAGWTHYREAHSNFCILYHYSPAIGLSSKHLFLPVSLFFVTCSSSFDGRRAYCFRPFRAPGDDGPAGSSTAMCITVPWMFCFFKMNALVYAPLW